MIQQLPAIFAGGGNGGLAAALALVHQGFSVKVLEQASEIGEIDAGIQLGHNAFHAFDALGIGDKARSRSVFTDEMVMHDALDETLVARTARIVLSSREMGRLNHANGVERLERNDLWKCRTPERFYGAMEWLYGWNVNNCLAAASLGAH